MDRKRSKLYGFLGRPKTIRQNVIFVIVFSERRLYHTFENASHEKKRGHPMKPSFSVLDASVREVSNPSTSASTEFSNLIIKRNEINPQQTKFSAFTTLTSSVIRQKK